MPISILDLPSLWLISGSSLTFLIAVAVGTVVVFRAQSAENDFAEKLALLPSMDELRASDATLAERRRELAEATDRLRELQREQAETERHRLDAEHWRTLAEQAERDYRDKDDKIREVEEIRTDYEEAAKDLAERRNEIDTLVERRDRLSDDIDGLKTQLDELEQRRLEVQELDARIQEMQVERDALRDEIRVLRDQREEMQQARFELDQLNRRKAELEVTIRRLPNEIEGLEGRKTALTEEVAALRDQQVQLRSLRDEVDRLTERKLGLKTDIEALEREKERLLQAVGATRGRAAPADDDSAKERLEDLLGEPACLFNDDGLILKAPQKESNEEAMLERVRNHLEALHFRFDDRIVKQFHTSLKTSRISPLTVLAGISGTGKSQLPQRYAEAIGMPFLKLAVQPRWDGPQDLLGFYNYLEKRYKATELARALVRMDEHCGLINADGKADDRMLLVLLDEMNLARVEYYFSEFLSRLEGRPEPGIDDALLLQSGRIEIDISLEEGTLPTIYPGHNVLFVGTMNEDESTQTLSDKVLDRANLIRFRRPDRLEVVAGGGEGRMSEAFLPFETWLSWHRTPDALDQPKREMITTFVSDLNDQLAKLGRPFGHRVNQAIFSYVANHPDYRSEEGVRKALADMLEMRILEKLRGVELEGPARTGLQRIRDMVRDQLQDQQLVDKIERAMQGSDLFTWTRV